MRIHKPDAETESLPASPGDAEANLNAFIQQPSAVTEQVSIPSSPPQHAPRRRSQRPGFLLILLFVLLTVLIAAEGMIGQRLFIHNTQRTTQRPLHGAFVQPPLNSGQVNELRHLSAHMHNKQLASLYVNRMSLDEKLGQIIMVAYADQYYSSDLDMVVNQLHAGGIIMYEFQMMNARQTRHDIEQMQRNAQLPLLVSADEEGGIVHRLRHIYPPRPSALAIYESGNPSHAAEQGRKVARDLLALGINVDLAPDVDVALIPNAPDQVTRTFGYTVDSVKKFAGPYMKAMQQEGVIACIKHFPGLGAAAIDAHFGLPVVNRSREEIYSVELAPFKHFIQSQDRLENPGMIMPTNVLMPAIDPYLPAELSPIFITSILRKQFGYDGVVLTDALYMRGVIVNGVHISMPQAAVLALKAGDDMLLGPTGAGQMIAMIDGIKAALQDGSLSLQRVNEAATRIITLKMDRHMMPAAPPDTL